MRLFNWQRTVMTDADRMISRINGSRHLSLRCFTASIGNKRRDSKGIDIITVSSVGNTILSRVDPSSVGRTKEHFNLPSFDTFQQLSHPEFEDEQKKLPDLTIGLLSYDPNEWSGLANIRMLQDDRVRLFDQKLLRKLENKGYLEVPFIQPGSSTKRVADMCFTFPFGFWEATREGGGYDHQSAQKQNTVKVKMILAWQERRGERAEIPWVPLLFHFVSVGSKFEVHGCHFQYNLFSRICVQQKLWSGDLANIDKALQLLYLVDIGALWGEHKYKPFAGACICRLHAKAENEATPPLEETLLAQQLEINNNTFSWLFPEQTTTQAPAASHLTSRQRSDKSRSHSQSRSQGLQSPQLLHEIRHLSLTSNDKHYIIPECDCFIWLLDGDIGGQDLLIVRIDVGDSVLVVFDSTIWGNLDFRLVVEEEQARLSKTISADFRCSQDGRSFVQNCMARNPGYFREPQCQFCAVVPLDPKVYKRLLDAEDAGTLVFEELEFWLGLLKLIDAAQEANERWCQCQAIYNEYSPNMILCNNVKCLMGWYHKKCVGLDEDFSADYWFCNRCLDKRQGIDTAVLRTNWRILIKGYVKPAIIGFSE